MVLGSVVRAMNRFKKSLNPEVDFRTNMETKRVSTVGLAAASGVQPTARLS